MIEPKPTNLYRYIGLHKEHKLKELESIIVENEVSLVSPFRFNDPFDCSPHFDFSSDLGSEKEFMRMLLREKYPKATEQQLEATAKKAMDDPDREKKFTEDTKAKFLPLIREKSGLLCLAERNDDIRMWSLYADSHKGVCLEFNRMESDSIFNVAEKVQYSVFYPVITAQDRISKNALELFAKKVFLTKAEFWRYEEEWRAIGYKMGELKCKFDSELLTGITLGCNISSEHEKKVLGWLKKSRSRVRCKKSRLKTAKFELDFYLV